MTLQAYQKSSAKGRRYVGGALAVAGCSLVACGVTQAPAYAAGSAVYNVVSYGANGGGSADNTAAFAAAIAAAQANGGGTVLVPAGRYAFSSKVKGGLASIRIHSGAPVTLMGQGQNTSSLVEHVAGQPLLSVFADGSSVERLTIDAQSFEGGFGLTVKANNTLASNDVILGAHKTGVIGNGSKSPFALYYPGPSGATRQSPRYNVGNQVLDMNISDGINNDGFSFSFQKNALITNIVHYGSRLALYTDDNVAVTNYKYTPNPICLGATNGFYIGAPSEDVTIKGFVTSGEGGIIGGPVGSGVSQDVSIVNETFTSPSGSHLEVGNVAGLSITGTNFNSSNALLINPANGATGTIQNSVVPSIQFAGYAGKSYSSVTMTFDNDNFPPLSVAGKPTPTFDEMSAVGKTAVTVNGGSWNNKAGGFYRGTHTTFTINGLRGQ